MPRVLSVDGSVPEWTIAGQVGPGRVGSGRVQRVGAAVKRVAVNATAAAAAASAR